MCQKCLNYIERHCNLAQRCSKGFMGAVEARSELGADAPGQFGGTQAFYGILGHLPLPLGSDGRRVHECYPVDYLGDTVGLCISRLLHNVFSRCFEWICAILTCLICSQTSRVTEDPEWKVTSTWYAAFNNCGDEKRRKMCRKPTAWDTRRCSVILFCSEIGWHFCHFTCL